MSRLPAPRYPLPAALALLLVVVLGLGSARAGAQDLPPLFLKGDPAVHRDRVELIQRKLAKKRERIRERRQHERQVQKALRAGKPAPARKVEHRPGDEDRVPGAAVRSAVPAGAAGTLTIPANTRANDKSGDVQVGSGQAEQHIVFLGPNGLCAWNDGEGFGYSPMDVQGFGYTTDGGLTWTDGGIPLKGGTIDSWSSDPVVAVNEKTGSFYYCGLTGNTGTNDNGVGVVRGHFAGGTFVQDAATVVASGPSTSQFFDKQWICADSLNGNLYVTWTKFTTTGGHIWFSRSTDDGATWSAPLQISQAAEDGLVSGSRPAVGPNGEVYVAYSAIGSVDADNMRVARSTNLGASFAVTTAAAYYDNYYTGAPGFNRGRAVTFPSIAVDRSRGTHRGRVYVAYQDAVNFYNDGLGGGTSKSEAENNAWYANATPFTINQTLRGTIGTTTDIDHWKFPATQGQTYIFYVDSLKTTTFKYTMRLYCPNDTLAVSRLAMSGDGTSGGTNVHSLIVWTAPTTATYYLRMHYATSTGGYRIRTGVHTPVGSDGGRDARDVRIVSSSDGGVLWSTPVRVNDEPAYYDDWLPEVAVPQDGMPYVLWYDWRNTAASCFGGSDIYVSRSADGGATWGASRRATTASTANWTQVNSNIAPNEGDYNGMYGGDCIAMSWADGRLGDADVYTARLVDAFAASGPSSGAADAGTSFAFTDSLRNSNVLFPFDVNVTLTADRAWPGLPLNSSLTVPEDGAVALPFDVPVPDSAATGPVQLCVTATLPNGALSSSWCTTLTVTGGPTGVGDGGAVALALHGVRPNPSRGLVGVSFALASGAPATLSLVDAGGRRVFEREVGSLGAGRHVLRLDRALPTGVYLVRLTQGGRTLTTKAAVVR